MAIGTIIRFNVDRGYGFIEQDNGEEDVFVDLADLPDPAAARRGARVEFNVLRNERGLKVADIRAVAIRADQPRPGQDRREVADHRSPPR
jgi:cold shock protein